MASAVPNVYQFRVTLKQTKPRIWRHIQVPEDYSFRDLHFAIIDAMGWKDCHLHRFDIKNPRTYQTDEIGEPVKGENEYLNEMTTKISSYFLRPKHTGVYVYDFGDGWEHNVQLDEILPAKRNVKYPQCINGKRACPLEDCGGVSGFEDLLIALSDPTNEEYKEKLNWCQQFGDFDPAKFDHKAVVFRSPKVLY